MELDPKQKKKLEKLAKHLEDSDVSTVESLIELDEKIDSLNTKIDTGLSSISDELKKKLDEELSYEVDEDQIVENVLNQIPIPKDGEPGKDGEDYILTDQDKMEIALSIDVPIVEKETVIEKTEVIHETPIVTENIVEKAVTDEPLIIADKLNTLKEKVEPYVIKGYRDLERIAKENNAQLYTGVSETRVRELIPQLAPVTLPDGSFTRLSATVTRNASGFITSIAYTGGKTYTFTRNASNFVTSKTDASHTWTYTRNGSNYITAITYA